MKLETLNLVELNESEKIDTSGGFFGWLKRLFGGSTEAKAEPAKNVGKRGDRTGKDGERSERGDRNGERRGGRGGRGGRRGERNDRGDRGDADRNDKGERSENTETRAPRENGGNRRGGERNERGGQRGEARWMGQAHRERGQQSECGEHGEARDGCRVAIQREAISA